MQFRDVLMGAFLFACCAVSASAQMALDVTLVEGAARAQRSQRSVWEELEPGKKIEDNCLVETFFQSRLSLQFGAGNLLIVGSNSRLLVNISEENVGNRKQPALSITVFNGGVLVRMISRGTRVMTYSTHAVGTLDTGALSIVVDEKTAETGFQLLEGTAAVRNVLQPDVVSLQAGHTTVVFPGSPPAPLRNLTTRHVAVLKHYYGDEYISSLLSRSDITPEKDVDSDRRRQSFVENLIEKKYAQQQADEAVYKPPINRNVVYGAVLELQRQEAAGIVPIKRPLRYENRRGLLNFESRYAFYGGEVYPQVWLRPSLHFQRGSFGLSLVLARDYKRFWLPQLSSVDCLLGLIDFAVIDLSILREVDFSIHAGALENLTLANGLVVDGFRSKNPYSLVDIPSFSLSVVWRWLFLQGFVHDVVSLRACGAHIMSNHALGHAGGGFYIDRNAQYPIGSISFPRFAKLADYSSAPALARDSARLIYELNLGFDIAQYYNSSVVVWGEFAQAFAFDGSGSKGYLLHMPRVSYSQRGFSLSAGLLMESGKLTQGNFCVSHPYLLGILDTAGILRSPVWFTPQRRTYAGTLSCLVGGRGWAIDLGARYDFLSYNVIRFHGENAADFYDRLPGLSDSLRSLRYDFSVELAANDSLLNFMKYCGVYIRQIQGRIYPRGTLRLGGLRGFEAGFDVLSIPLIFDLSLKAGLNITAINLSSAGLPKTLGGAELLPEFHFGMIWGYW